MASDKQDNKSMLVQGLVLVGVCVPCIVVFMVVKHLHQPGLGLVALSILLYFLMIVTWIIVRSCVGRYRAESDLERQSESSAGPEQVPGAPVVAKTPSHVLSPAPADHLGHPPPYETLHTGSSAPDGATVASESCERQCGGRCERCLPVGDTPHDPTLPSYTEAITTSTATPVS